jgi:LDH2 family malate/lactate/ureidoglycolate dehydrogenase
LPDPGAAGPADALERSVNGGLSSRRWPRRGNGDIARHAALAKLPPAKRIGVAHKPYAEEALVMTLGRLRLSVAEARDLAEGALAGIGYPSDEARIIADHVIDAALCGYEYSGLAKILNVPESDHFRSPRHPMTVLRETEISLALDGGNNVGMLALFRAAQATIKKAGAHGLALVSVTDAWMSGRSAYYVELMFIAFRPDLLGPADLFERRVTQLIETVKATPRRADVEEIRIPSERAFRTRERLLREGLEIDRSVFDALVALKMRSISA